MHQPVPLSVVFLPSTECRSCTRRVSCLAGGLLRSKGFAELPEAVLVGSYRDRPEPSGLDRQVYFDPAEPKDVFPDRGVYFDNNATSPVDPRVADAMEVWLRHQHGNPSSVHRFGQMARQALVQARERVAALVGADPLQVVFTGSGTEANNAVLRSLIDPRLSVDTKVGRKGHVVVSGMEHPSVLNTLDLLVAGGIEVATVAPRQDGLVAPEDLLATLRQDTRLVSVMLANNELGTIQPVAEIAAICHARGIPVLCDAVQAAGKIEVSLEHLGVDYLTLGAHKFHGPLGAAALVVQESPRTALAPFLTGGSQERNRRAGTENLPALVGFGVACELARAELDQRREHLSALRRRFEAGLRHLDDVVVHCADSPRLPHTSHVAFLGVRAHDLLVRLDLMGFAVSTGAACASGVIEPSATLLAMGMSREEALASLRVSFGMSNTLEEVVAFLPVLEAQLAALPREVAAGEATAL